MRSSTASLPRRARCWPGSEAVLGLLNAVPNGVQAMSSDIPGLVQTSLNLGILTTDADAVRLTFSVRSSVNREKFGLIDQLKGAGCPLRRQLQRVRRVPCMGVPEGFPPARGHGRGVRGPVRPQAGRGGYPCRSGGGIFSDRLPGLDAVSFGPQMHDIHTSRERLDIASTARTWEDLVAVLERL